MAPPSFLSRARRFFAIMGGVYAFFLILLMGSPLYRHLLYMHKVKWPLFPEYDLPQKYGFAPNKVLNVKIPTADNETLGAWFAYSDPFFLSQQQELRSSSSSPQTSIISPLPLASSSLTTALRTQRTILFFHGNGAHRAIPYRASLVQRLSLRLRANVLIVDYRGFGDSSGTPSEEGIRKDARAAWDWIVRGGAKEEDVLILGHSLGTAAAAGLLGELAKKDIKPLGLALISPFSSLTALARTYTLFGIIPLLSPLTAFPGVFEYLTKFGFTDKLDTAAIFESLPISTSTPILLLHASNDLNVPSAHSHTLFSALLEPLLPTLPSESDMLSTLAGSDEVAKQGVLDLMERRLDVRKGVVSEWTAEETGVGSIWDFLRGREDGRVKHVEFTWGGHDAILRSEGLVNVLDEFFGFTGK